MSTNFFNTKSGQYIALGGAAIAGVVFVVWYLKKQAKDAADAVGGLVSGNNALTKDTPYEGAGIVGTLGAGANAALGGAPEKLGDWLGTKFLDLQQWVTGNNGISDVTYFVQFADGSKHAVNSASIDSDGYFNYGGAKYRLGLNSQSRYQAVAQ